MYVFKYIHHYIYIYLMVGQNSFIRERPFFANLSPTPCLSFAEPMLSNNSSYEDSFTQNYHGKLLHSLENMQLVSRNPLLRTGCCWLGNLLQGLLGQTLAHSLAKLSRIFRENTPIRRPQPSAGGASEENQTPGALVFGSRKASLLEAWLLHLELVSWDFRKQR